MPNLQEPAQVSWVTLGHQLLAAHYFLLKWEMLWFECLEKAASALLTSQSQIPCQFYRCCANALVSWSRVTTIDMPCITFSRMPPEIDVFSLGIKRLKQAHLEINIQVFASF